MTAMIDYNAGNVFSVAAALRRLGEEVVLTDRADVILSADRVVFPGVGYADAAMKELERRGLVDVLRRVEVPFAARYRRSAGTGCMAWTVRSSTA